MIKWVLNQVVKSQDVTNIGGNVTEQKPVKIDAVIVADLRTMFFNLLQTGYIKSFKIDFKRLTVRDMSDVKDINGLEQGNCQQYNGIRAMDDDWSCYIWQTSNNTLRAMLQRYGDMDNTVQYIFTGTDSDIAGM